MLGMECGGIIVEGAIDAIIPDSVKAECSFRGMTFKTTRRAVGAHQGESIFVVQLADIVYQPVFGVVASGAISPHGLLVHVGMAGNAFRTGFGEYEALVAASAIDRDMLPKQRVIRFIVMKAGRIGDQLPAGCSRKLRFCR